MSGYAVFIIIGVIVGIAVAYSKFSGGNNSFIRVPERDFPHQWKSILEEKIDFYKNLNRDQKKLFEHKVHIFLLNVRIIGIQTQVSDTDRILIASSGVIPIFGFPNWHYSELCEIHLYPDKFLIPTTNKMARGLVGWGEMEGKMLLSKKALYEGFQNQEDGVNVAIHEFIHLIDKEDGGVDGILEIAISEDKILPWLTLIRQKMEEIKMGHSSIRGYGGENKAEFLAVVGEYFFENPEKMKREEPDLFMALDQLFNPTKPKRKSFTSKYDKCPCGSGKRFGDCCSRQETFY